MEFEVSAFPAGEITLEFTDANVQLPDTFSLNVTKENPSAKVTIQRDNKTLKANAAGGPMVLFTIKVTEPIGTLNYKGTGGGRFTVRNPKSGNVSDEKQIGQASSVDLTKL